MAKSKVQKQQEALARKRNLYVIKLAESMTHRPGGAKYNSIKADRGAAYAEFRNDEVQKAFGRYLKEAQLDAHGNPLAHGRSIHNDIHAADQAPSVGTLCVNIGKTYRGGISIESYQPG